MSMYTRCDGDVTIIVRTPDGWLYAVNSPLAIYTGEVDTLHEALTFALTGDMPHELDPGTVVSLARS